MFSNFEKIIENILFYRFKSRISGFNKNGIHAKYFLSVFGEHSQKNFFSRDTFKRFDLFNLSSFDVICPAQSTTAILKTDTFDNVSCECYSWARIFKSHGRASVVRAVFREITVFLHSTKLSRKLHHVHCYVRKGSSSWNFEKLPFD